MPLRRFPLVVLVPLALVALFPAAARADSDSGGGPDENRDVATPGAAPADNRPSETVAEAAPADASITIFATAAVVRVPIDDFRYDELVLEGTAREVCAGRLLTGSGWTFNEIVSRFGGSAGTMYFCRERWDAANDPACNGQQANPVTTPNFHSTCWSNHARGRAIDIMVGRQGSGYNRARGLSIVNWLLARDAKGNVNSNARKLGIQQILFDDRCWNSDGDRGIASWTQMRACGIGHHDHVHLDLTLNGANGNVSYWGRAPVVAPKHDTQVFWDRNAAWRQAISWFNLQAADEEGLAVPAKFDRAFVGDLDNDGTQDEIFLWDNQTGDWAAQNWTNGDSLMARIGRWSRLFDDIIIGDWDGNGRVNDMIVWDRQTGHYGIQTWVGYSPRFRAEGYISPGYERIVAADLDGNGRVNDMLLWDQNTGKWVAFTWSGLRPVYRALGYWGLGYDEVIVGDWSAGGDLDEILLWDRQSGRWQLFSWAGFRSTYRRQGYWSTTFDIAAPGDYDTDGRVDDLFMYDIRTGRWTMWSYHRNVPSVRISQDWFHGYDVISVGSFMD
jgi:hypothetical protein